MKAPKPERLVQPRPPFSTVHSLPGQIRVQPIGQPPLLDIRLVGRLLRPRSGCSATHLLALQLFRPHTSPRLSPNRGDNLPAHPSPNSTFNRCQRSGRWFWPPGRLRRSQWYSAVSSPSALSTCLGKPPVVLPPPNDLFVSKRQRTEQSTSVPRPNSPAGSVPHHRQVARVISPPTPSSQQQHPPTVTIHPSIHPPIHPSTHPPIHPSTRPPVHPSIQEGLPLPSWSLQRWGSDPHNIFPSLSEHSRTQ